MADGSTNQGTIVDPGTMLKIQGAIQAERGFAQAFSAGASPAVQAAYMRSADEKAKLAVQNIQNRYWKKEFEQILDTRVKPLQDRLVVAQKRYDQLMATTVMPTGKTVSPDEYQMKADSLGQGGPVQFKEIPGAGPITEKNKKPGEVIPQQPAAPNAALGKEIGAVEYQDALALVDPVSGQPVPLSSPRGINLWRDATKNFWGEYSSVNQELMQIMADYPGNPYADNYARSLMDNVIKQGNIATTGKADPLAAQQWMDERQAFEADQELKQQQVSTGAFELERREAGLDVSAREAEQLAQTDTSFAPLVGKKILGKFENNQPLTRQEKLEAASAVRTYRTLQEKQIAERVRSGVFNISPINLPNPSNWQSEMRTKDPVFKQYFGEEYANVVNNLRRDIANMSPEERRATLSNAGASTMDIEMFEQGETITPGMKNAFDALANGRDAIRISNDRAEIRRLPELEKQQPEVSNVIDQTIDDAIMQMKAEGLNPNEDLLRTDRYRVFFELVNGREAPIYSLEDLSAIYDPETLSQLDAVIRQQQEELNQRARGTAMPVTLPGLLPAKEKPKPEEIKVRTAGMETPRSRFEQALMQYEAEHPKAKKMREERLRKIRQKKAREKAFERLREKTPKHRFTLP